MSENGKRGSVRVNLVLYRRYVSKSVNIIENSATRRSRPEVPGHLRRSVDEIQLSPRTDYSSGPSRRYTLIIVNRSQHLSRCRCIRFFVRLKVCCALHISLKLFVLVNSPFLFATPFVR
ncbi:hypothetical protein EVAR_81512_1 [Eumeta japonica]|uniref:Uncharacterized protein n=1 Tax=Eumeta variegata TaxID=151549 RepID=A0A4C1W3J2_EUMVA|nr:hypothetical protein EVAR_81512_1 [Eumeta japonica]